MKSASPRIAALAYRIWAYANPRGWDCTIREIADALDAPVYSIVATVRTRGWTERLRASLRENPNRSAHILGGKTMLHEVTQQHVGFDE